MTGRRSLFDKLWDSHIVAELPGGAALVAIDRVFLHERTGAAALNALAEAGRTIMDPARVFAVTDHIVDTLPGRTDQTLMPGGQSFIQETRAAAKAAGITMFDVNDPDQGIVHVISPELGIVLPGCTLIAPDSHTCTQGAFGALAWGVGSSEAEHAMATGTLRLVRPKSMRVKFTGQLSMGVTPKDMILALLSEYGAAGGKGHAVEFTGSAVSALDMEGRMTLCNMSIEAGARAGLIAPDAKTFEYLKDRPRAPKGADWDAAVAYWQTLHSDADAVFDREITIDAANLPPLVTWGTSPQDVISVNGRVPDPAKIDNEARRKATERALSYMGLEANMPVQSIEIDRVFIGSCTNSRIEDLRAAAKLIDGKKVSDRVNAMVVPGSGLVKKQAEAEGLDKIFLDAGFEWRDPGCSMCLAMNADKLSPQERCASTSNRNFEGRQGREGRTHLVSPAMAAAAAIRGHFVDIRDF